MKLTSDSLAKIAPAIVKAQSKMGNALKDSNNPFFKSKYADLNAVREAVLPAFNENGISVLQPTVFHEGKKFVQTILIHESGEFFSGLTEILSAKELNAQEQGSGISYARRYGLQSLANVGAEDDDGNADSGKKAESIRSTVSTSPAKEVSGDLKLGETLKVSNTGAAKADSAQTSQSSLVGTTQTVVALKDSAPAKEGSRSFRKPKPAQEEL